MDLDNIKKYSIAENGSSGCAGFTYKGMKCFIRNEDGGWYGSIDIPKEIESCLLKQIREELPFGVYLEENK